MIPTKQSKPATNYSEPAAAGGAGFQLVPLKKKS